MNSIAANGAGSDPALFSQTQSKWRLDLIAARGAGGHGNIPIDQVQSDPDNDQPHDDIQQRHFLVPCFLKSQGQSDQHHTCKRSRYTAEDRWQSLGRETKAALPGRSAARLKVHGCEVVFSSPSRARGRRDRPETTSSPESPRSSLPSST